MKVENENKRTMKMKIISCCGDRICGTLLGLSDEGEGSRVGAVVRALASHQCVPGSIPGPGVIRGFSTVCCWFSILLFSILYSERFFSGYSGFPLSSKTNISKFQFDLDVRHFSHEPLARVIAQALLDVKTKITLSHEPITL